MSCRRLLVCMVVVAGCALAKPPPPAPPRRTELGLSIKAVTLGNGLRVVLVQDPHASEVQVTMRYRVGSADDLEHPGIAHLVEHLMFQQTLGAQTLIAHLEDNATYFNGVTTFDATTYVSRARPDFLDKLLSIEAVRLGFRCTSITDSAFEREREVVMQELKLKNDAFDVVAALHAAVYPVGHAYRSGRDTVATVSQITRAEACAFADAYYAPSNAALVISGKLSNEQVEAALGKFLARVAKRVASNPGPVAAATKLVPHEASAPVDKDTLLVTWPLPPDPADQIRVRVLAAIATSVVDGMIKGRAVYFELGDVRAPVVAIAVEPGRGETIQDVLGQVQDTFHMLPTELDQYMPEFAFDSLRQHMIYAQFASLEDGSGRDARLAAHVLAGRDPGEAVAAELRAVRGLDRKTVAAVLREHLAFDDATLVTLKPAAPAKTGHAIDARPPVHDMGQRRKIPDVARAHEPDRSIAVPSLAIQTRVLPNGLKVVLLPLSTVPTIDMRLVFDAGTADEPATKRGAALVAAHALTLDLHHVNDAFNFAVAGGTKDVEVTRDHTSFAVRGVDMHMDYLLAGLRRWVVDGRYADSADLVVDVLQRERKRGDDEAGMTDAWQTALYGANHPYARAGMLRYASSNLAVEDAEQFRAAYFTPDNATLVIAGKVDVALVDRWIDFLFADWRGHAQPRQLPAPAPSPASIAKIEDLAQLQIRIALPAPSGSRAQQLVAAEMVDEIARDVRHQLGATYGFSAALAEQRLASLIVLGGWVEPARANDVVALLRERIDRLRNDPDAAARAFVTARARVVATLASVTGSASFVAARAEGDVELARPPMSDLATARDAQALTIDQMTATLAGLDLSRAAMLMRGPEEPIKAAFAALGREPTLVRADPAADDALDEPPTPTRAKKSREQRIRLNEIDYALTDQGAAAKPLIEGTATVTLATGSVSNLIPPQLASPVESSPSGIMFNGEIGLRFRARFSAGLHLGIGTLSGTYPLETAGVEYDRKSYGILPIDAGAYIHSQPTEHFFGGLLVGVHFDGVTFDAERTWQTSFGVGAEGGYELFHVGSHWFALVARATAGYGSDISFGSLGAGIAYRH